MTLTDGTEVEVRLSGHYHQPGHTGMSCQTVSTWLRREGGHWHRSPYASWLATRHDVAQCDSWAEVLEYVVGP